MIFRSIEISQFRKFRGTITVAGLADGLNVISGDNEEGKSTLLTAVRAALFERFKSSVGEGFRPYGQNVSPRVRLVFELRGATWTLEKTFSKLKAGGCTLRCSDGRGWENDEAEDCLKDLLGFEYGARGSKKELQGLPGLLWVEQAHAYQPVAIADGPRDQLRSVFDSEMTELLGGDRGQAVYDRIGQMRSEYFDKRNNPRGDYKKCIDRVQQLQDRLPPLDSALRDYDHKVERLEKIRSQLMTFRQCNHLAEAEARLEKARAACVEVEAIRNSIGASEARLSRAVSDRRLVESAWQDRQKLIRESQALQAQVVSSDEQLQALENQRPPLEQSVADCRQKLAENRARHKALSDALDAARNAAEYRAARQALRSLESRVKKARSALKDLRECEAQVDSVRMTRADLESLRKLDQDLRVSRQTLEGAATRLDYALESSAKATLSGQPIAGTGKLMLAKPTDVAIQGVGTLRIQPGGEALEDLQLSIETQTARLAEKLNGLGAGSLQDAEQAWQNRERARQLAEKQASVIEAQAPDGLESLETQLAEAESAFNQLAAPAQEQPGDEAELTSEIQRLEILSGDLQKSLETHLARLQALNDQCIELRTQHQSLRDRATALAAELESRRATETDDAIAQRLASASDAVSLAEGELQGHRATLAASSAEAAGAELAAARDHLQAQELSLKNLETAARDLEVELATLGRSGLAEALDQAQIEANDLQRELDQMHARANALDLLHQTMTRNLESAKAAVARPVIEKLRPRLNQLLPDAEAAINQDLELTGLTREGADEPFEKLSIGTREQLAILVRLAYADLLHEHGMPVTVILDDALVNSDDQRRDRMKKILAQAAGSYQIIVLTCHERDYRDSEGHRIRLRIDAEYSDPA